MKKIKISPLGGFTLIELLVVVLIIGILSAVALPQYRKAVIKTRYSNLKVLVHSVAKAAEVYYMANGEYPDDFSEMDIDISGSGNQKRRNFDWGTCFLYVNHDAYGERMACENSQIGMGYELVFEKSSTRAGKRICLARNIDLTSPQNQVCKQETLDASPRNQGTYYEWYYQD